MDDTTGELVAELVMARLDGGLGCAIRLGTNRVEEEAEVDYTISLVFKSSEKSILLHQGKASNWTTVGMDHYKASRRKFPNAD